MRPTSAPGAAAYLAICLALLVGGSSAQSTTPTRYRDPSNRFTLDIPAGWKVRPLGDSVQVVREDSYLSVLVFERSANAGALVEELGRQMGRKWSKFAVTGQEDSVLSGYAAAAVTFAGVNPQGVVAVLRLNGVVAEGTGYVVVIGCPKADLAKTQGALTEVEKSFRVLSTTQAANPIARQTLGLDSTDLSEDDASTYGLKEPAGALVVRLEQHGAAAQAGIALHDLIVAADHQIIDSSAALQQRTQSHKPGDVMELEFLRLSGDGAVQQKTCKVVLGATPSK